jgi:hypothetical protein
VFIIKNCIEKKGLEGHGVDSSGKGKRKVAGYYDEITEPSVFVK